MIYNKYCDSLVEETNCCITVAFDSCFSFFYYLHCHESIAKDKVSNILTGFWKGHSAQHSLLVMIEKWRRALDEIMKEGTTFTDISMSFDTLNHKFLLSKFKAYGLQPTALKKVENYLTAHHPKSKVNNAHSSWYEVIIGVPEGSILVPLLCNMFLNDSFLYTEEIFK